MSTGTVHLHRVLRAPPDRVYRAFVEPSAMVKWLPPHGYTAEAHHMDVRVGGGVRMSFTHFASGQRHSFGGDYLELVPGERLRYTDTFDDPNLPKHLYEKKFYTFDCLYIINQWIFVCTRQT